MRGFSTSITVVVAAIVILITAIVVISILTGGLGTITDSTSQANLCRTSASSICQATGGGDVTKGSMPPGWTTQTYSIRCKDGKTSQPATCVGLTGITECSQLAPGSDFTGKQFSC